MIAHTEMLCFSLYAATHAMQQTYRGLLDPLGLTYPQYIVLTVLWTAEKPLSVGEIGRAVHLESSTLTPLLKRLERADLVERRRAATDERRVDIHLTRHGQALREQVSHIPTCIQTETGLTGPQIAALTRELTKLAAILRDKSATD